MKEEFNSALIVAARPEIRDGLRALLMATPQIGSVNQVANAPEALQVIRLQCPTLVLLDVNVTRGTIQDLLQQIKIVCPNCRSIVLIDEACQREEAESSGADAVLMKGCPTCKLCEAVCTLLSAAVAGPCP